MLEGILKSAATGGGQDHSAYASLRREFMAEGRTRDLLPSFVRTYRTLDAFWPWIKDAAPSWAERREIIGKAFTPLIDSLEGRKGSPSDSPVTDRLSAFDPEGVHTLWLKALDRRMTDPEGAITMARTLLETVMKKVLDEVGEQYSEGDDLPKLYANAAKALNLAPSQHAEDAIKSILGGATKVVHGLGTLRNKMSDAHGRGGPLPVRASPRHASLAVNMAGTIATFLVETLLERRARADIPEA